MGNNNADNSSRGAQGSLTDTVQEMFINMRNEQPAVLHFKHCWLFFDFRDCSVHSSVLVLVKLFPKVPDPGAAPTLVVHEGGLRSETDITKDPEKIQNSFNHMQIKVVTIV